MSERPASETPLRMAELLPPLSLITDLGMGEPDDQGLRATALALDLAEALGLDDTTRSDVYYTTLLRHIGCTATAFEESLRFLPDEIGIRPRMFATDFARPREVMSLTAEMVRRAPPAARPGLIVSLVTSGSWGRTVELAVCEVATTMARRLGMSRGVQRAVFEIRERWDGKGEPARIGGDEIAVPSRVAQVAAQAVCLDSLFGPEAALAIVRSRAGGWFDPRVADAFERVGASALARIGSADLLPAVIDAEPDPPLLAPRAHLDGVAAAFADMTDLKAPCLHGHSSGVAILAASAGAEYGLGEAEVRDLRRAGLMHDLGRISVPTGIWNRNGPLSQTEWERIRLHAYQSERVLARCPSLAPIAPILGMHHERQDGSGYHRQLTGAGVPPEARILAAADCMQAMTQPRPYREAWTVDRAATELTEASERGEFDREAVRAVCHAAGAPTRRRLAWPAGLTEREVEVLRFLASGSSNREIAARLYISRRTAEHHVQHIYAKIGCSTRAGAAMFAMEHDLLR